MKTNPRFLLALFACSLESGCATRDGNELVGAWRGKVQFKNGPFAEVKDLEFMYVFNEGGTMTESSNYDGAPPVPPAYGMWRQTAPDQFEVRYEFYTTKPPANLDDIAKGGGWLPAGRGVLSEKITLSEDGRSFKSTIKYDVFDDHGKPAEGGGEAETKAKRIDWN